MSINLVLTRRRRRFKFGNQEPGSDEEISEFCSLNHGVTFPLMKKSDVNGDNTNEVYQWLKNEKSGVLGLTRIKVSFFMYAFRALSLIVGCSDASGTLRNSSLTRRGRLYSDGHPPPLRRPLMPRSQNSFD